MRRRAFWMTADDEQAMAVIRDRYGVETDTGALRLALRILAASPMLTVAPEKPMKTGPKPREKVSSNGE